MTEPSYPIAVEVVRDGQWTVVRVEGDLDMATSDRLAMATPERPGGNGIALDLERVRFIDSTGLRTLLDLRRAHGSLVLIHPSGVVRRLLQLTETASMFEMVEELGEPDRSE